MNGQEFISGGALSNRTPKPLIPSDQDATLVGAPPQKVDPKLRAAQRESYRQYIHALERAEREKRC